MSKATALPLSSSLLSARPASPLPTSPFKRKSMSITQTYFLAHKARAKLSSEAARPDHNLRLLVGHANLLDSLMVELADAEREQESWFNQSVRGATTSTKLASQDRHVQWADAIIEDSEEDWIAEDGDSDSSSDSDSEFDEEDDVEMADMVTLRRVPSQPWSPPKQEADSLLQADHEEEDDEDFPRLALSRTPSHSGQLPELDLDSESSEDESMPPSPPTAVLETFSEKQDEEDETMDSTSYYESATTIRQDRKSFYDNGFYLPPRNPARLISAISVY